MLQYKIIEEPIRAACCRNDEFMLFNTKTYENIVMNSEAFSIWNIFCEGAAISSDDVMNRLEDKYKFSKLDVDETLQCLFECNFIVEV